MATTKKIIGGSTISDTDPMQVGIFDVNGNRLGTAANPIITQADLPGTPVAGTTPLTTAAAPLAVNQACHGVLLQADPDNTPDVLLGDVTSQTVQLTPGQPVTLECTNLNQIYAKTASSTGAVNWIAFTDPA